MLCVVRVMWAGQSLETRPLSPPLCALTSFNQRRIKDIHTPPLSLSHLVPTLFWFAVGTPNRFCIIIMEKHCLFYCLGVWTHVAMTILEWDNFCTFLILFLFVNVKFLESNFSLLLLAILVPQTFHW
jgi:hypothetical protein